MPDITMPQLGETVTEGTITRWLKQVGDQVAHDEPLFEVSTDKVDSEVPSSLEGVLTEILVEEGATVDVGTRLAVIGEAADGNAPPAPAPADAAQPAQAATAEPAPAAAAEPAQAEPAPARPAEPTRTAEPAPAAAAPVAQETVQADGSAPAEEAAPKAPAPAPEARAPAPAGASSPAPPGASGAAALLSPVVRKLINEHGIDPASIAGSGQGGRITRADVLSYLDRQAAGDSSDGAAAAASAQAPPAPAQAPSPPAQAPSPPAPAPPPAAAPAAARPFPAQAPGERDEIVPFNNIRKLTSEHMVRSKATSAHTLAVVEADYEGIERVRRLEKDRFKAEEGISLSYLPFVARAVVDALRDYPHLNASVGENALVVHRDVHLGIAVDLDRQGLIVPVVRNADGQSLRGLARAVAELAERARTRRLGADDVVGGTFTITNPGPFGTFLTAPIINQPQVAILSTDGVKRRPVVVTAKDGTEAIAIHSVGMLGLSFDHRAVDGAYASAFLRDLAKEIETRDWLAEL